MPAEQALPIAQSILEILQRRGAPNYFGPQRFGDRYESHLFGYAMIKGQTDEFFDLFLGRPESETNPQAREMRELYLRGDYEKAFEICPKGLSDHKRALKLLCQYKGGRQKVFNRLGRWLTGLFVSAWQSDLFNRVLAVRMPAIDRLLDGDMAIKHDNGACFKVEDAAAEQPRCDDFAISPTGPLFGRRMTALTGPAGEIENHILEQANLNDDDFRRMEKLGARGGRRPMRFQPRNVSLDCGKDDRGEYLQLGFELDSGCYATTLLREITKTDLA
jgi:tRNA pseudouridine13 synthase